MILRRLNILYMFSFYVSRSDGPYLGRAGFLRRYCSALKLLGMSFVMGLAGCQSLVLEGSSAGAGIAGAALAHFQCLLRR